MRKINVTEYYTNRNLKPWGTAALIQERVNRESFVQEILPETPLPPYTSLPEFQLPDSARHAFIKEFLP